MDTPENAPLFESLAKPSLDAVQATFTQRGTEYGDTWKNCQFTTLEAIGKLLGLTFNIEEMRCLALAALVDLKHQRIEGGYKEDSLIDGIAYSAALIAQVKKLAQKKKNE